MIRILGGLVLGLLIAIVAMMSIEALGNYLFGRSPDSSPSEGSPVAALLFLVGAWFVATLVGAWIAMRISRRAWTGWAVAGCIVAAVLLNFLMQRYPTWLIAAGIVAPPLATLLARPLAGVRRLRTSA